MVTADGSSGVVDAPSRPHLQYVEGMRAAAALAVFVNHAYAQIWNPDLERFPSGALAAFSYFLVFGHLSVTVFIVISGFCLTLPVVSGNDHIRGGTKSFLVRRAWRILPPYYAAIVLCLILIGTILSEYTGSLWDVPLQVTPGTVLSHLLLLQDLYGTGSINYVFWSIAVEWQIYFLFPLLVWLWRRIGPRSTVTAAMVVGYGLLIALGATRVTRANPHYLGMFGLGMLAAYVARSTNAPYVGWRARFPWLSGAVLTFALVGILCLVWGLPASRSRIHWLDLPTGLMTACALVSASKEGLLSRLFSWKPLVLIGTFSYSLYLVHAPLLQLLWRYLLRGTSISQQAAFGFLMTIGLLVVLGSAYVFFRIFEAPFMRSRESRKRIPIPMPSA
jgi:peptidoglycan/LPS O-acetylase OafA/YrhL